MEKCVSNGYKLIFIFLSWLKMKKKFRFNKDFYLFSFFKDQIYSCNLVRMVCEVNNYKNNDYNLEQLKSLAQVNLFEY